MTRLEALRALLVAVEAGDDSWPVEIDQALGTMTDRVFSAMLGSITDVAQLEVPLRQRGWVSEVEGNGGGEFYAALIPPRGRKVHGRAASEAVARVAAAIRALIQEEAPEDHR